MKKEEFDNKKKLVYDFVTDKEYKPMSVKEMAMVLQVPAAEKKDLRRVVEALCEEGKIHISQRGKVRPLADQSAYRPLYGNTERVWICPCCGRRGGLLHPGASGDECTRRRYCAHFRRRQATWQT